jgi:hypothetical protein
MNSEKYTLKQAKTAKRIIKYFAKFQASIFLMSKGKLWNKWPGGFPIMVVETKGAKTNKIRNIPLIYVHQDGHANFGSFFGRNAQESKLVLQRKNISRSKNFNHQWVWELSS